MIDRLSHSRWDAVAALAAGIVLAPAAAALAGDEDGAKIDKGGYTLFNPTPDSALRSFAPDRPSKSTGPTTVDAGRVQLESDFFIYSHQKTGSLVARSWVGPNPTVKLGLASWLDVEANIAPFMHLAIEDRDAGTTDRFHGQGDLFLRAKVNLWGNDGGKTAFGLIPWVKAPTAANGLGNDATEGGVIAALQVNLPGDASLFANSEVDVLKDATAGGYHRNYVNTIGINVPLIKDVTLTGELWSAVNDEPDGRVLQMSLDAALAWAVRPDTQLDVGANFGLNGDTPRLQVSAGIAQRY